ncbi:DUF2442 domain-containing protein [Thiospirillum jenense]|uniref:DUF2442 domain-containing protein n=1 Tax=Thiospirillum jenense TaxID=1653858 RepID=A0A839HLB0_9GAMM|nr:DUF2442 domain-containing protein [Thiospirillum jenense]MBB1127348.1 DUF2442 domain-containing protein [Thiospirillum jenense]
MTAQIINIVSAVEMRNYRIQLTFDDGTQQCVDFKPFLTKAVHPDIRAYLDPQRFSTFRIEYGELVWGEYDFCFPMMDLYCNQIEKNAIFDTAA